MSFNFSSDSFYPQECIIPQTKFIITGLFVTYIILLPLFILVLCMGYQRWRKQSSSSPAIMTSHTDVFTYHMTILELISIIGVCFYCLGSYTNQPNLDNVGLYIFCIISPGETLFHILTFVERYLAVVCPVTYLSLRQAGGVMIRNISIGCVWLISFSMMGLAVLNLFKFTIISVLFSTFSIFIVAFCSFSVLFVLTRPRPGEVGGNAVLADQSKQRALRTMMAIMGVLLLRLLLNLFSALIQTAFPLGYINCLIWLISLWFYPPCSLVLPLLFLQRAGKLLDSKKKSVGAR